MSCPLRLWRSSPNGVKLNRFISLLFIELINRILGPLFIWIHSNKQMRNHQVLSLAIMWLQSPIKLYFNVFAETSPDWPHWLHINANTYGIHLVDFDGDIGVAELKSVLHFAPLLWVLGDFLILVEDVKFVLVFLFAEGSVLHINNKNYQAEEIFVYRIRINAFYWSIITIIVFVTNITNFCEKMDV